MREIQEVPEQGEQDEKVEKNGENAIISTDVNDKENDIPISKSEQDIIQNDHKRERRMTAFERLSYDLNNDHKCVKEITLGKRIGFYRIRGELGTGNFSQVKMGIHALTKEKVAVKILDKTKLDQKTQRLLSREISNMEKLHHPNIIRLYEVVETLAKLHIVMEYAGGGELFNKISNEGKFPEDEAKLIYAQVVAAVLHMHDMNIIHRDLKAENVFYAGPKMVKVGDFGFSTISRKDEMLNTFCGSPPYAAPELFKDESYYGVYVDVWAMGILMYFMLTGIMPFRADTVAKLKKSILEGQFTIPSYVSDSGQFLIRGILRPVPQDRFTMAEICRAEWLAKSDFPGPHEPYNVSVVAGSSLSESEQEAHKILCDLGIGKEHFQSVGFRDSRSSITGTYRIILHKVHRRKSGYHDLLCGAPDHEVPPNNAKREDRKIRPVSYKEPRSKFCTIL